MTSDQCARKGNNLFLYAVVFTACINSVNVGFILGWPMTALPEYLSSNSTTKLTRNEASWIASFVFPGIFMSVFVSGLIMNKYGAKRTIMASVIPSWTGWIIIATATQFWVLLIGRFILGISISFSHNPTGLYISELADANTRGRMCAMCGVAVNVGFLLSFGLGHYLTIPQMAWLTIILLLIYFTMIIGAPDSPYWYSKTRKYEEMKKSLIRLRRTENVQVEFDDIKSFAENDVLFEKQSFSWKNMRSIFSRRVNRRAIYLPTLLLAAQQSSGIQAINSYTELIFESANSAIEGKYVAILIGSIGLCCNIISSSFVDNLGRKPLIIVSTMGTASCMFILGIYYHLQSIGLDLEHIKLLPVCMVLLFTILYGLGLSCLPTVISGDCTPVGIRAVANTIQVWMFSFVAMMITKLWQVVTDSIGQQYAFGTVALITYINAILILIFLPETKGKTLCEVQEMLSGKQDASQMEVSSDQELSAMLQYKKSDITVSTIHS